MKIHISYERIIQIIRNVNCYTGLGISIACTAYNCVINTILAKTIACTAFWIVTQWQSLKARKNVDCYTMAKIAFWQTQFSSVDCHWCCSVLSVSAPIILSPNNCELWYFTKPVNDTNISFFPHRKNKLLLIRNVKSKLVVYLRTITHSDSHSECRHYHTTKDSLNVVRGTEPHKYI